MDTTGIVLSLVIHLLHTETSKDQMEISAELTDILKNAAENPPPKTKVH